MPTPTGRLAYSNPPLQFPTGLGKGMDLRYHAKPQPVAKPRTLRTLDVIEIGVNSGIRLARVLAVDTTRQIACVEYTMPNGTTGLRFVQAIALPIVGPQGAPRVSPVPKAETKDHARLRGDVVFERPCTYQQLTKAWLAAIIDQAGSWKGNSHQGQMPTPQALMAARFKA